MNYMRNSIALAGVFLASLAPSLLAGETSEDAIRKSSSDFAKAFSRSDAKAVASFWTEQGEYHSEDGTVIRGRAAIEKSFSSFFKQNPRVKVDVLIGSIRFPAENLAIEEGLLRQSGADKEMPNTTHYSLIHAREGGQWKIALTREWGAGQDRLEDLDWLLGDWKATSGDQEVVLSLGRDGKKPFVVGTLTTKSKGKVVSAGTLRIGFDGQKRMLRSWHFDDDGGHGEALWQRDGNRWILHNIGVLGDGTQTASVNLLTRLNNEEIIWRSTDRVVGGDTIPDTTPIKLSRVAP